jgi:hypothetical protein
MDQFEQRWQAVEEMLRQRFEKVPDMEGILFLIGVNELGQMPQRRKFTKEQKQDLMHIAVCTLLSQLGYYEFEGRDADGWPHFRATETVQVSGLKDQERILKECVIRYFDL